MNIRPLHAHDHLGFAVVGRAVLLWKEL